MSDQIIFVRYLAEESTTLCLSEFDFVHSANLTLDVTLSRLGNLLNVISIPAWSFDVCTFLIDLWTSLIDVYKFDWWGAIGWR